MLLTHYKIHNIFYVSYLKSHKHYTNNDTSSELSSFNLIDDEKEYKIEKILNLKCKKEQ